MPILYKKFRPRNAIIPPSWRSQTTTWDWYNNLGDELFPNSNPIDVVNDFAWTLTPTNNQARKEAPFIYIKEFFQLETQLNQCLLPYDKNTPKSENFQSPWTIPGTDIPLINPLGDLTVFEELATAVSPNTNKLYKGLFDHTTPTYFEYKLPFFTQDYFNIQNNWEATDVLDKIVDVQTQIGGAARSLLTTALGDKAQGLGNFLQSLPSIYKNIELFNLKSKNPTVGLMDPPHVWKSTANRTYSFEFPLYNISQTGLNSENLIIKNWEFCYLLTYQNLINKRNFYTGIPPVFYEVLIPGIHYCKASYISDLTITNLGNIRLLNLNLNGENCDVNVPDAYSIKITFTDLLQPSKNLLEVATTNTTLLTQIQIGEE